jgi:hypothetical protein
LKEISVHQSDIKPAVVGFDINAVARAIAAPLLLWTTVIALAAWQGYPGAACMTPMAWLLGCWVGLTCSQHSRTAPGRRLAKAFVAGALLGLAQGAIFYVVQRLLLTPASAPPAELQKALILSLGIILFGALFNGLCSVGTAAMRDRGQLR